MNRREQARVRVLLEVAEGRMTVGEGAESMGLSVGHTRRMLAAFRKEGALAIAHGKRKHAVLMLETRQRCFQSDG